MLQLFVDYIKNGNASTDDSKIDYSDQAFAYDYNEVQELLFDEERNNCVILAGKTGLRKKGMLGRIYDDLLSRGILPDDILYLNYELPITHELDVIEYINSTYEGRAQPQNSYLLINEIQEYGDWVGLLKTIHISNPGVKVLASSSTPRYIFERIYDEKTDFCKIIVLSDKNASNIKYKSQSFGTQDEFKYNVKDGFVEIKGLTKEGKGMTEHVIPSEIDGIPVKVISSGAFHDRSEITAITIPDSVELIGDYAFSKCSNIKEMHLPHCLRHIGDHAFLGASSLRIIDGGDMIEHIGNSAFYDTPWLDDQKNVAILGHVLYLYRGESTKVTIPDNIKCLGPFCFARTNIITVVLHSDCHLSEGTFYQCENLATIVGDICDIPAFCFYGCSNLNTHFKVRTVGKFALFACTQLKSISAETIAECAMCSCSNLTDIGKIKSLCSGALHGCTSLRNIDFSNVEEIGAFAISDTSIEDVALGTVILDDFAFSSNGLMRSFSIGISSCVGYGVLFGSNSIVSMAIPGDVKVQYYFASQVPVSLSSITVMGDIADDFCRNNHSLKELHLKDITSFGRWCFYKNDNLAIVDFENVHIIGDWAFAHCSGLESIKLSPDVSCIGMNAFRYCINLFEVIIESNCVVSIGVNAFYALSSDVLFYVQPNVLESYRCSDMWDNCKDSIASISGEQL